MRLPFRRSMVVVAALAVASAARADVLTAPRAWQGGGRVELGVEHDTNPARVEDVAGLPSEAIAPASPATRAVLAGDAAGRLTERLTFAGSAAAAGRVFLVPGARDESVAILQAAASLSERLAEGLALTLATSYYDGFQKRVPTSRDFRAVAPSLRLDATFGPARTFVGGGYRWFTYKPEASYDFTAPTALTGVRVALVRADEADPDRADWELAIVGSWEGRTFQGQRCVSLDACPPPTPLGRRQDQFVATTAEVTRTGDFLAGLGVSGQLNASNTYGESLQRLIVFARGSFLLPASLSLSARADLVLTRYEDRLSLASPAFGQPLVTLEDESRTTFRIEVVRPIGEAFEVAARWTWYTSAPATGAVRYDRHVVMLVVGWVF